MDTNTTRWAGGERQQAVAAGGTSAAGLHRRTLRHRLIWKDVMRNLSALTPAEAPAKSRDILKRTFPG
jgi:hypothetical protein